MTALVLILSCPTCQHERLAHRRTIGVWYDYFCSVCKSRLCRLNRIPAGTKFPRPRNTKGENNDQRP